MKKSKIYDNKLDRLTWKEYITGGTTKSNVNVDLSNVIYFILTNRTHITNATLPHLEEEKVCKGCECSISRGENCLKITLDDDDDDAYYCYNCTKKSK